MQMGGRRDRDGIDAGRDQRLDLGEAVAADGVRHQVALLGVGIGDADELHARQIGEHAGMVAAHDADADHADAQNPVRASFRGLHHGLPSPPGSILPTTLPSTARSGWRWLPSGQTDTFRIKELQTKVVQLWRTMPDHWARYCRSQSRKRLTPSAIGVFGRNPTARSRSATSAQVSGTSPGCIGSISRSAGLPMLLLDQPDNLGHLDRAAVADVVDVPGGVAGGRIGSSPRPVRVGRRRVAARAAPPTPTTSST